MNQLMFLDSLLWTFLSYPTLPTILGPILNLTSELPPLSSRNVAGDARGGASKGDGRSVVWQQQRRQRPRQRHSRPPPARLQGLPAPAHAQQLPALCLPGM